MIKIQIMKNKKKRNLIQELNNKNGVNYIIKPTIRISLDFKKTFFIKGS